MEKRLKNHRNSLIGMNVFFLLLMLTQFNRVFDVWFYITIFIIAAFNYAEWSRYNLLKKCYLFPNGENINK